MDESDKEFNDLVKLYDEVKKFRIDNSANILKKFHSENHPKFKLTIKEEGMPLNLSSNILCVYALSQYQELLAKNRKDEKIFNYNLQDYYNFIIINLEIILGKKSDTSKENIKSVDEFSILNTLHYLKSIQNKIKENKMKKSENEKYENVNRFEKDNETIIEIIRIIYKQSIKKQICFPTERSHPYIYYKFLYIIQDWALEISNDVVKNKGDWTQIINDICEDIQNKNDTSTNEEHIFTSNIKKEMDNFVNKIIEKNTEEKEGEIRREVNKYFSNNKIYENAKFEMYRQMAFYSVPDRSLFDVKRLIYSLLIVLDYNYSNNLITDEVLGLIFNKQFDSDTGLFPIGRRIRTDFVIHNGTPIDKTEKKIQTSPIIPSVECLKDLFTHKKLKEDLEKYIEKLDLTYNWIIKRSWKDPYSGNIEGWFSDYEKSPMIESWMAGHILLFLKKYQELLSDSIKKNTFIKLNVKKSEELTSTAEWDNLKDSYEIKKNIEYMMKPDGEGWISNPKYCSALIFGPPGSGKSSIVKALAKRLEWDYVEIAPHLFLTKGKESIVPSAIQIFNRLLQMKKTVIFFDEVDQLVKSRKNANKQGSEESIWIVTSLLLKFQELRDQKDIKFILATNDITEVDIAAKRPGRIDAVLPMGAICWQDRLKILRDAIRGEDNRIEEHLEESGDIFKILINESTKLLKTHNEIYKIEKKDVQNKQLQNYLQRTNFMPFLDIKNIIERLFNKKNWESIEKEEVFKIFFVNRDNRDSEDYKNFEFENFHTKLINKSIKNQIDKYIYLPIDADISKREYIDHIKDTIFRKC